MLFGTRAKTVLPTADEALPGRQARPYEVPRLHAVLGTPLEGAWPTGTRTLYVAMGCFWGAEQTFWQLPGVVTTAVGYMGGTTPHPTYEETCTGRTGHTETVLVAYDPTKIAEEQLLRTFWESHDPTQGYRQGNDLGTQYRSAVYWTTPEQERLVRASRDAYAERLRARGYRDITTELRPESEAGPFYYAEEYHQQYLYHNKFGYCPNHSTGVSCPIGTGVASVADNTPERG